jgi:hypothetical protein
MKTHRVVRRRGSQNSQTIGSQMAVRLSASRAGRPLPPGRFISLGPVKYYSAIEHLEKNLLWQRAANVFVRAQVYLSQ